ncbi:MAG: Peptidyl-tRNA hydrolase [Firmicutes bacterium ADurb.Bin182]|nr:MAG: Peptidyl-tRNA hydrolase [Firmicutes bacterium ADurb.Bin182]
MYLVIGLGNPGPDYAKTRHNAGFLVVDNLSARWGIEVRKRAHRALMGEGNACGQKVVLAKPQTYMNLSGMCVADLFRWYKCEHYELILVYDDADLPSGHIRIREGGSAGTHNGMRSVIYQLGFDDFPRVRIGIGSAEELDLADYVLSKPGGEEAAVLNKALEEAADAVEMIVRGELQKAQAKYNRNAKKKASGSPSEQ